MITEAAAGGTPEYLQKLESMDLPALGEEASRTERPVAGRLPQSLGLVRRGSPIREMAEAAKAIGHRYWALPTTAPG